MQRAVRRWRIRNSDVTSQLEIGSKVRHIAPLPTCSQEARRTPQARPSHQVPLVGHIMLGHHNDPPLTRLPDLASTDALKRAGIYKVGVRVEHEKRGPGVVVKVPSTPRSCGLTAVFLRGE